MDLHNLISAIHDKGYQDKLLCILDWWYENSDLSLRKAICNKLEELAYKITQADAEQIVRAMKPRGQNWSVQQICEYLEAKGITDECTEYYLVMNMAYNDYYATAKTFDLQDDPEFFFSIARDFIEDVDARPYKVAKYFAKEP